MITDLLDRIDHLSDSHRPRHRPKGDQRSGDVYVATPRIITAVKVALVTGRPLLLGGPPGSGKSSLASYIARNLGVDYQEFVADDESRATDLLWTYDPIRRLNDAQAKRLEEGAQSVARYIEPGPLWWALDPDSAARRGLGDPEAHGVPRAVQTSRLPDHVPSRSGTVLLIDEIDKADAAFVNGLLVPLGSRQFTVTDLGAPVVADPGIGDWNPLVIITTNNERDLPEAFLRRCVLLELPALGKDDLIEVACRHFTEDGLTPEEEEIVEGLAAQVTAGAEDGQASTAEFIDLVNAALVLRAEHDDPAAWKIVSDMVVRKNVRFGRRRR